MAPAQNEKIAPSNLRVAGTGDSAAVGALLEASYVKLFAKAYDPELMARVLPLITRANPRLLASGTFYVVQIGPDLLVGCGGWSLERPGSSAIESNVAHVRHFATHPDWTRRGIGRAVLDRCINDVTAAGMEILECYSSLASVDFYRACGFAVVRIMDLELTPEVSIPGVLMQRRQRRGFG